MFLVTELKGSSSHLAHLISFPWKNLIYPNDSKAVLSHKVLKQTIYNVSVYAARAICSSTFIRPS